MELDTSINWAASLRQFLKLSFIKDNILKNAKDLR